MHTKHQSIKYAVKRTFLINDFLEWFLLFLDKINENKYINLIRHWTIFFHKAYSSL